MSSRGRPHLVEAGFEVQALALLVDRSKVAVQGSLVPLRPAPLAGGAAALEHVLQLLFARATTEDRLAQGELRDEASGGVVTRSGNRGGGIQQRRNRPSGLRTQLSTGAWVSQPLRSTYE